jgi:hypothetical protein
MLRGLVIGARCSRMTCRRGLLWSSVSCGRSFGWRPLMGTSVGWDHLARRFEARLGKEPERPPHSPSRRAAVSRVNGSGSIK